MASSVAMVNGLEARVWAAKRSDAGMRTPVARATPAGSAAGVVAVAARVVPGGRSNKGPERSARFRVKASADDLQARQEATMRAIEAAMKAADRAARAEDEAGEGGESQAAKNSSTASPSLTVESLVAEADELLNNMGSAVATRPSARDANAIIRCDESGCTIVGAQDPIKLTSVTTEIKSIRETFLQGDIINGYTAASPEISANSEFEVVEGQGWRLGFETVATKGTPFVALVGAGNWSVALSAQEFTCFCQLMQTLRKNIAKLDEDGFTGQEDVVLEVSSGSVWMQCSVPRKRLSVLQKIWKSPLKKDSKQETVPAFEVRFVLSTNNQRQVEGFWPAEAVADFLQKTDEAATRSNALAQVVSQAA